MTERTGRRRREEREVGSERWRRERRRKEEIGDGGGYCIQPIVWCQTTSTSGSVVKE